MLCLMPPSFMNDLPMMNMIIQIVASQSAAEGQQNEDNSEEITETGWKTYVRKGRCTFFMLI